MKKAGEVNFDIALYANKMYKLQKKVASTKETFNLDNCPDKYLIII